MKRTILSSLVVGPALLLAALAAPAIAAAAGPLTSPACTTIGTTTTCDVWAKAGTTTLPDTTNVAVLGYTAGELDAVTAPGGPELIANAGDTLTVHLHNALASESTSLVFNGLDMVPDLVGAAAGGDLIYTLNTSTPGTYLYGAAPVGGTQHQVAMGLYGMLIIRPTGAAGQAYDSASTAFDDEAAILVSELDPALNASADPSQFDLRAFAPQYFLINGRAYPDTAAVDAVAGNTLLVRYANAGLRQHSMATLGVNQLLVAEDGSAYTFPRTITAETVSPGQTYDALVAIPAGAAPGTLYALGDATDMFVNAGSGAFGGMLTFLAVGTAGPPGPDVTGPSTSGLSLSPNPTNGSVDVTVAATVSDVATGNNDIAAAEFFTDATGASGSGTAMSGAFASPTESVTGTLTVADLATLGAGTHTVYVHGQDFLGNWGPFNFIALSIDATGPLTTDITLTPAVTNGFVDVAVSATADDTTTGGSNIAGAEYRIDGGTASAMTLGTPAPISSVTGTISAATVAGLSDGTYAVEVRSQDVFGNWGDWASTDLVVDTTGPVTSNVVANPNPTDGSTGYNSSTPAVRVTATFDDPATVKAAEGFIDTVGATGTGFVFTATDGVFNASSETGFADIPLTTINTLSNGSHTIWVRALDAAGNWGATATTVLVVDKPPLYFSTSGNASPPGVSGNADDADIYRYDGSTFVRLIDASVYLGFGNNVDVDGFSRIDNNTFYMSFTGNVSLPGIATTVADEDVVLFDAGTWTLFFDGSAHGLTSNQFDLDGISVVEGTLYFSIDNSNLPPGAGGTGDAADVYSWTSGSSYTRVLDASTVGVLAGANVDGLDVVDATHLSVSFADDTTIGALSIQDEDVVAYDAGTWSVYFDGTSRGLTANGQDIDALDVP